MRNFRRNVARLILVAFIFTTFFSQYSEVYAKKDTKQTNISPKTNQILVKYKNDSKSTAVKESVQKKLKMSKFNSKKKMKKSKVEVVEIGQNDDMNKALKELQSNPDVQYAQPDYLLNTNQIPIDQRFGDQWGLYNNGQTIEGQSGLSGVDINAVQAWNITQGSQTTLIGVMDTGIDINHPDLKDNIYINTNEISNNGIDDDGNGVIDDINGWDFVNKDKTVYDSSALDAHGTHVAGVIAARANSQGIVGVAPNVKILPLKFMNGDSGYTSDAIEAIEYANSMGVKIVNCSWSGQDNNIALKDAMANTDILFVCAAGNEGYNTSSNPSYPTSFNLPNVISVGAVDNRGYLASFSNYGSNVQVVAPGVNILSTLPDNSYGMMSGTSMAAPYVTGIAALIKSMNKGILFSDIADRIKSNAVFIQTLAGKVSTGGRVDAYFSLTNTAQNSNVESEPNNTFSNATQVNNGQTTGYISSGKDIDWYKINLQAKDNIIIKLNGVSTGNDFDIELYSKSMAKLGNSYNTKNADELIGYTSENPDTYYIKVFSQSYVGAGEQKYNLSVDIINNVPKGNEPNETKDNATSILLNKAYTSTLYNPADIDWYSVQVNNPGKLVTTLKNIPKGSNYDVELYNPNGDCIGGSYSSENSEEKSDILINNPGKYFIKVYSTIKDGLADSYEISLSSINSYSVNKYPNLGASSLLPYELKTMVVVPDTYENNDTYSKAKPINSDGTISATIDNQNDQDWYKITLAEATNLYFKLKNIPAGLDYDLTVFDKSMSYIAGSLKRGSVIEDINANLEAGIYYVKVSSFNGFSDQKEYTLLLSKYMLDEYESNDSFSLAKSININQTINATIHNLSDQDYYKFNFDEAGKIDIQLNNIPQNCNYELELYDINNKKIKESKQEGNNDEVIWADIPAGDYYIKVYSYGGFDSTKSYSLSANRNIGLANSVTIGENSSSSGIIATEFGSNWYETYITTNGVLSINLNNIPENCSYRLNLYDASGHLVAKSDNSTTTNQSIDFIVTQTGKYYTKVYSIFGYNAVTKYILTTKFTSTDNLGVSKEIAQAIVIGTNESNELGTASLKDELMPATTLLPREMKETYNITLPQIQEVQKQNFKVTIDPSEIQKQKTTLKTADYTGVYTIIQEACNTSINYDGKVELAQILNANTLVKGKIQPSDPKDYYVFRNSQRGKAIVEINNVPVGANLKLGLTSTNWNINRISDNYDNYVYIEEIITDPTDQYYIIEVSASDFTANNVEYDLKITFMPEEFVNKYDSGEMKNNDNFGYAPTVRKVYGNDCINYSRVEGTIDFKYDYDVYKMSLDSGYKFSAVIFSPGSNCICDFTLCDSKFNIVNYEAYYGSEETGKTAYRMDFMVPTSGTYYLVVFSERHGSYDIFNKYRVDFYTTRNNESTEFSGSTGKFNESWENAQTLSLNTTYPCKLDNPFDNDTYSIAIPAEGKITLHIDKRNYNDKYIIEIKDTDNKIFEYVNPNSDYVFYAQKSGTYKVGVYRLRDSNSIPDSINYDITFKFTPKTNFDSYEYIKNPNISTTDKNVDFLYANNQYRFINDLPTNLAELNKLGEADISMDNPYDLDWFVVNASKLSSNNVKLRLTGISSGDDYSLVVVDTVGNILGCSNNPSNKSEELSFRINNSNSRYYVGVYVNSYNSNLHKAHLDFETINTSGTIMVSDIGNKNTGEEYLEDLVGESGAVLSGNVVTYLNKSITYDSTNSKIVNGRMVVNAYDFASFFTKKSDILRELARLDPQMDPKTDIGFASVDSIISVATLGEQSENVRNIQKLLQKLNCWYDKDGRRSSRNATGYYGETTQASLIRYQIDWMNKKDLAIIKLSCNLEIAESLSRQYSIQNIDRTSTGVKTAKINLQKLYPGLNLKSRVYNNGHWINDLSDEWNYEFNDALWNFITDYGYKNQYISSQFNKNSLYNWIQNEVDKKGTGNSGEPIEKVEVPAWVSQVSTAPRTLPDGTPITSDNKENETTYNYYKTYIYPTDRAMNSDTPILTMYYAWLQDVYGSNWLERFWGVGDSFIFGCGEGAVSAIEGTFHCITHPVETAQGIAFLYKASHPSVYPQETALLGEIVKATYEKCKDEFVNGDANVRATMIGRVVGEFVIGLIGSKGITKATSTFRSLNASGRFAGLMRYFIRGEKSGDEIAAIMEGASDATSGVSNTVQTFLGEVESIRSSPLLTRALRREGNIGLAHCDVPGVSQYFKAHSKVSFSTDPGASYGFTLAKQSGWVFESVEVGGYNRYIDTEAKILEQIASQLGNNTSATGTIRLFTEAPPCASCTSVIQQFKKRYPNITLKVFDEFFREW